MDIVLQCGTPRINIIAKVSRCTTTIPLHDEEKQVIKVNQSLFTLFFKLLLLVK